MKVSATCEFSLDPKSAPDDARELITNIRDNFTHWLEQQGGISNVKVSITLSMADSKERTA